MGIYISDAYAGCIFFVLPSTLLHLDLSTGLDGYFY